MYGINSQYQEKLGYENALSVAGHQRREPTIGENIDQQIERLKEEIVRLEGKKERMKVANLLDLKISNLREAMSY